MKDVGSQRRRAITLMREAIKMLDNAREDLAAAHLQAAIDTAERVPTMKPGDKLPESSSCSYHSDPPSSDPALVRAMGGALAVMATVIARGRTTTVEDLAQLLGIYGITARDSSEEESLIIAYWGSVLRDVSEAQRATS